MQASTPAKTSDDKQRAREQWGNDPAGAVYGSKHEFGTREFFDEVERHRYQEYAPWMPEVMGFNEFSGAKLLEVGCGMGTDLLQFARGGAKVTGVDLTPRSIETSRHHLELYGHSGEFAIADCERLPFAEESFDVAYSNGVLHHTPDTAAAVREIHRVLRAGGLARVMLYHRGSWAYWSQVVLRYGILRGEFLRGTSANDIMSKYVEFNAGGGRPLVKAYSRREARELFSMFRDVTVQVEQLLISEFYFLRHVISQRLFERLQKSIGWNVIISARR
jgi:2-polyprenyl-3-methyl-5-hydroxy-6-metoxy-1,4-benzoquinol methylase